MRWIPLRCGQNRLGTYLAWILGLFMGIYLTYLTIVKDDNITVVSMKCQGIPFNPQVTTQDKLSNSTTPPAAIPTEQDAEDIGAQCTEEKQHVMFLKIEKTGGGTFEGILVRFGLKRKLRFAVPVDYGNPLGHFPTKSILPGMITKIARQPDAKFDILYRHSVYNRTTIQHTFPNDTVNIVSVRHPFSRFLSSFDFFFDFRYKRALPVEVRNSTDKSLQVKTFINRFYRELNRTDRKPSGNWYLNLASRRLGMRMTEVHRPAIVKKFLEDILPDFKLVLLNEYYDESLVLLKRMLCWELEDIVYLSIHVRAGLTHKSDLWTPELLRQHQALAPAEYAIYDKLSEQFWAQVHREGLQFWSEVKTFKAMNRLFKSFCQSGEEEKAKNLTLQSSPWHGKITFVREDCDMLTINLEHFTKETRESYLRN